MRPLVEHVSAPAPRFMLRLLAFERLLDRTPGLGEGLDHPCEVGAGLGDVASYVLDRCSPRELTLYESFDVTRERLRRRFRDRPDVKVRGVFVDAPPRHDLVLCFEVIEHIDDDLSFVSSLARALRPGGRLIGSVPAFRGKWQAADEYAGHVRRYDPRDMRSLLARAGLEGIELEVYGFPLTSLMYLPHQLYYGRRTAGRSAEERLAATHSSGVSRDLVSRFDKRLVYSLVRPMAGLQHLPLLSRLGDGLLFTARRPRGHRAVGASLRPDTGPERRCPPADARALGSRPPESGDG